MSMTEDEFRDRDERAAWELLGRHEPIDPSFGFVERTVRRLNEPVDLPERKRWGLPALRWAVFATAVVAVSVTGWIHRQHAHRTAAIAQAGKDPVEDLDVIASLDQL